MEEVWSPHYKIDRKSGRSTEICHESSVSETVGSNDELLSASGLKTLKTRRLVANVSPVQNLHDMIDFPNRPLEKK